MSEQVGEVHIDVHADSSGLSREVSRAAHQAAAAAGDIEIGITFDRAASARLAAAARRAAREAETTVKFTADADFSRLRAQAKAAALAARQRVEIIAHLDTKGFDFDGTTFRHRVSGAVASVEELQGALADLGQQTRRTGGHFGGMAQIIENSARAFSARVLTQFAAFGILIGSIIPYIVALAAGLGSLIAVAIQAAGSLVSVGAAIGAIGIGMLTAVIGTQGLTDAFKAQAKAQDELIKKGKVSEATQKELDAAMKRLAPSAREFVKEVIGLRDEWSKFQRSIQQELFRDLGSMLRRTAQEVLPALRDGFKGIATVLNQAALSFLLWVRSADGIKTINAVLATAAGLLDNILRIAGNVGKGLLNLFIGAGPGAERFLAWLEEVTQKFAAWTQRISSDGTLDKFLSDALTALKAIAGLAGDLVGLIGAAIDPGQAGKNGLELIDQIRGKIQDLTTWLQDPANRQKIEDFWSQVHTNLDRLFSLLEDTDWGQILHDLQGLADALYGVAVALSFIASNGGLTNLFSLIDGLRQLQELQRQRVENANGGVEPSLPEGVSGGSLIADWFKDQDWFALMFNILAPIPAAIGAILAGFGPQIAAQFSMMWQTIVLNWPQILYSLLAPLPAGIVMLLNTFAPQIGIAFTNMFSTILVNWPQVAYNLLAPLPAAIVALLSTFGPQIAAGFTIMFSSVPNIIAGVIISILGPFSGLAMAIIARAGSFTSALTGWFSGTAGIAVAAALNIISPFGGLASRIIANAGSIYSAIAGWFAGLGGLAQRAVDAIIAPFVGLGSKIASVIGSINLPGIPGAASGMIAGAANGIAVTRGPQLRLIGEAGPEAIVPLRATQPLDPAVAMFLKGVAADRWGTPKPKEQFALAPQINVTLPTDDPEAAAMAVWNRLVFEGVV